MQMCCFCLSPDRLMDLKDEDTDTFVRTKQHEMINLSRQAVASFLGAAYENIYLVENATKGDKRLIQTFFTCRTVNENLNKDFRN